MSQNSSKFLNYPSVAGANNSFIFTGTMAPVEIFGGKASAAGTQNISSRMSPLLSGNFVADSPFLEVLNQLDELFRRLENELARNGSGLNSMLFLRVFVRDKADIPWVRSYLRSTLGDSRPAGFIAATLQAGFDAQTLVVLDCIAAKTAAAIRRVPSIGGPWLHEGFSASAACNGVVFTSMVEVTALSARTFSEYSDGLNESLASFLAHPNLANYTADIEKVKEMFAVYEGLLRVLDQNNCLPTDIVRHHGLLKFPMKAFSALALSRQILFSSVFGRAASTTFVVNDIAEHTSQLGYSVIASAAGDVDTSAHAGGSDSHPIGGYYLGAKWAQSLCFTAGEVPVDGIRGIAIDSASKLEDAAWLRYLVGTGLPEKSISAQAVAVYRSLRFTLMDAGTNFNRVLHQTIYTSQPMHALSVQMIGRFFFGGHLPATSVVEISATSPKTESALEIELIAG